MSYENQEIGELLDLLGNDTRRRILESLANDKIRDFMLMLY